MKINSSSLKDDVTAMVKSSLRLPDGMPADSKEAVKTFIEAAIEFGTTVIDHDRIETVEDLEECTQFIVKSIEFATLLLVGGVKNPHI